MLLAIQQSMSDPAKRRAPIFIILWLVWLLTGTLFYGYAPENPLGFWKGWYMACNVGYSIGFGFPVEPYEPYLWFSTVYIMIGATFVAVALGFFADKIGEDNDDWFTNLVQKKAYEETMRKSSNPVTLITAYYVQYEAPIRAVVAWAIWIGIMTTYSLYGVGWSYVQAQYFAITTLSTGGHWGVPDGSPIWMFGVTAFFTSLGVPLMGMAMAQLATLLVDKGDLEATKKSIVAAVTGEELHMLRRFGLENGDGVIDCSEFIILCMVRMGLDPTLIEFINSEFKRLDDDNSGYLTIEEVTGGKYFLKNGQIVSREGQQLSVRGLKSFSQKHLEVDISSSSSEGEWKRNDWDRDVSHSEC